MVSRRRKGSGNKKVKVLAGGKNLKVEEGLEIRETHGNECWGMPRDFDS